MEEKIPKELSCDWDNDGMMLCADSKKEIKKAVLTLDLTPAALEYAVSVGADAIFTHHPFIFKGIRNICDIDNRSKMVIEILSHNISVFSYHTRLDAAVGGVNDILSQLLEIDSPVSLGEGELAMARIGYIKEKSLDTFADLVKKVLCVPSLVVAKSGIKSDIIHKVCVLGGACDREFIYAAIKEGADVFICGDASYNSVIDANIDGIHMICAGHYFTEVPVLSFFDRELSSFGIECKTYNCGYFEYI